MTTFNDSIKYWVQKTHVQDGASFSIWYSIGSFWNSMPYAIKHPSIKILLEFVSNLEAINSKVSFAEFSPIFRDCNPRQKFGLR